MIQLRRGQGGICVQQKILWLPGTMQLRSITSDYIGLRLTNLTEQSTHLYPVIIDVICKYGSWISFKQLLTPHFTLTSPSLTSYFSAHCLATVDLSTHKLSLFPLVHLLFLKFSSNLSHYSLQR